MKNVVVAEGMAVLQAGGKAQAVWVYIGEPTERPDNGPGPAWTVTVTVSVGDEVHQHEAPGSDSLEALCVGLTAAAVEVNRLRERGQVCHEGFTWEYYCLDQFLRTPATNGYLPTGIDRPADGAGPA